LAEAYHLVEPEKAWQHNIQMLWLLMKIIRILTVCVLSSILGAGVMYFYGFGVVLTDNVYRDNINSMKVNAFTLYMLKQGKAEVAVDFLNGAVDLDKERLNSIPVEDLSQSTKKQLEMLHSIYDELESSK
jgi:hypothetical protein